MEFVQWNDNLLQLVNDVITRLSFDLKKQTIKWNKFCCYNCFNFNEDTKNGHLQVHPPRAFIIRARAFSWALKSSKKNEISIKMLTDIHLSLLHTFVSLWLQPSLLFSLRVMIIKTFRHFFKLDVFYISNVDLKMAKSLTVV